MNKTLVDVIAASIVLLAAGLVAMPRDLSPPEPAHGGYVDGFMAMRLEKRADGNWTIWETGGSHPFAELRLQVMNASTGAQTVYVKFTDLLPAKNNPDALLIDSNSNKKWDAGDYMVLDASSPNIEEGYKVQILDQKGNIVGTIKELQ